MQFIPGFTVLGMFAKGITEFFKTYNLMEQGVKSGEIMTDKDHQDMKRFMQNKKFRKKMDSITASYQSFEIEEE